MADQSREYLPQRAVRAIEEPSLAESSLTTIRARVQRFALPGVVVLAVAAGLVFGGLAPKGMETQATRAVPAPSILPSRDADEVTRSGGERTPEPTPEAPLTPQADAAPQGPPAPAEPKSLTGISVLPTAETAKATGKMYATETVNIRAEANSESDRTGSVEKGEAVPVTGKTSNDFTQVVVNGKNAWVSSEFLSRKAPAATSAPASKAPQPTTRQASASGSTKASTAAKAAAPVVTGRSCAPLPGVRSNTEAAHQAMCARFPQVKTYLGVRADWDVEHPSGRAIDAMTSDRATGDAIANWARANAGTYGITEVIWNQRIWTTQRAGEGWRPMSDRGSPTANHINHVHVSFR